MNMDECRMWSGYYLRLTIAQTTGMAMDKFYMTSSGFEPKTSQWCSKQLRRTVRTEITLSLAPSPGFVVVVRGGGYLFARAEERAMRF